MQRVVSELTETVGEGNAVKALGLTLNGEHVVQHALVSGLLALEVLVTGSLPAAMLTQVGSVSKCWVASLILNAHSKGTCYCQSLLATVCYMCRMAPMNLA